MKSTRKSQLLTVIMVMFTMIATLVPFQMPITVQAETDPVAITSPLDDSESTEDIVQAQPVSISMTSRTSVTVGSHFSLSVSTNTDSKISYSVSNSNGSVKSGVFYGKKIGKVKLTVTAAPTDTTLYKTAKKSVTISVNPKKPTNVKVSRINKNKSGKIKFTKASGVTGYQLQYTTDSNFKKNVKSARFSTNTKTFSTTASKTYYYRIRSYKKIGSGKNAYTLYSSWVSGRAKPVSLTSTTKKTSSKVTPSSVYITKTGSKYHYRIHSNMKHTSKVTLSYAKKHYSPCKTCVH